MLPRARAPKASRQRGVALLLLVVVLGLTATTLFVISRSAVSEQALNLQHNARALGQARAALLGRAVADPERPGSLPCPDTNNDGVADLFAGNDCPSYTGRLPWRTLQLPDLRDAAGERLWYALSPTLRDHSTAEPINSDTPGDLMVTGTEAASDVAAIVFAPGRALALPGNVQSRSGADVNDVRNYLEGENSGGPDEEFESAPDRDTFNDELAVITRRQLFSLVEIAVARRIEKEIKPLLAAHHAGWGSFPFAAAFTNPAVEVDAAGNSIYVGSSPALLSAPSTGLLPVDHAWKHLDWQFAPLVTGSVGVTSIDCQETNRPPAASCNCGPSSSDPWCSNDTPPKAWRCRFDYSGSPTLTLTLRLLNAGRVFSTPVQAGDLTGENFTVLGLSQGVSSDGIGGINLNVRLTSGEDDAEIVIPPPCPSAVSDEDSDVTAWFVRNKWYRLLYYAVDDQLRPGASGGCLAPGCLTVNGLDPANDKGALLVFAGGALPTQRTRPISGTATVADFFEDQNATPADLVYETKRRGTAFNDRVVVLKP